MAFPPRAEPRAVPDEGSPLPSRPGAPPWRQRRWPREPSPVAIRIPRGSFAIAATAVVGLNRRVVLLGAGAAALAAVAAAALPAMVVGAGYDNLIEGHVA